MKFWKYLFMFLLGCFIYSLIEIAARGYTHWSMCLTGGFCLAMLYGINNRFSYISIWLRAVLGAVIITGAEFVVGFLVNIRHSWNVWDYSDMPLNIGGQICFPYSIGWFFLSFAGYGICYAVRKKFSYDTGYES